MKKIKKFVASIVLGISLVTLGVNMSPGFEVFAQNVIIPQATSAYKSAATPYTAVIGPKENNSSGKVVTAIGGEYTIKQTAYFDSTGKSFAYPGSPVILRMNGDGSNVTFNGDGDYSVVNTKRFPGYFRDTTEYKITYPLMANGVVSPTQNYTMVPKLKPVVGNFTFNKLDDDGGKLEGVTYNLTKIQDEYGKSVSVNMSNKVTDANGQITYTNLPEGTYTLKEVKTVNGYALDVTPVTVKVTVDSNNNLLVTGTKAGTTTILVGTAPNTTAPLSLENYKVPGVDKKVRTTMDPAFTDNKIMAEFGRDVDYSYDVIIPKDIATYKKYTLTDNLDPRLIVDNVLSSLVVRVDGVEFTGHVATMNGNLLTIDFPQAAMKSMSGKKMVRVEFNTKLDATKAKPEEDVPNTVVLSIDNNKGFIADYEDTVYVIPKEGAIRLNKKDNTTLKLQGAEFVVYQKDGVTPMVNPVDGTQYKGTTDANGIVTFMHLPFGDYVAKEVKAPIGYRLNHDPIPFTIKDTATKAFDNVEDSIMMDVINYKESEIFPGTGTNGLIGVGAGVAILSIIVIGLQKAKKHPKMSK